MSDSWGLEGSGGGSGGSGGGGSASYFSPVDRYSGSEGDYLGNYTVGCRYLAIADVVIKGLRFHRWTYAATMLGEIWIGGSTVGSKSQAVDPQNGVVTTFTLDFDSPISIPAWTDFFCTNYDGGTRYTKTNRLLWEVAGFASSGLTLPYSAKILLRHPGARKSGTGQPDVFSDNDAYSVEPVEV